MKIIKVPSTNGALSKKQGLEKGPDAVVKELKNFYLKENGILPFFDIEEIKVDNLNTEATNKKIFEHIQELMVPAVLIGGDHSITYPSFKAFAKNFANPGLIVFDAHLDCENDFRPPTHEDYLRVLIEEGIVKKENVLVVGIRNMHANEIEFSKKNKLKIYDMKELSSEGKNEISDAIMTVAKNFDALYISVDIDAIDPVFAPGTGYIEPGGMTTRELIYFIQRLKNLKNIKMWDLVEVNPEKDVNNITAITAAKLVVEMS